MDASNRRFEKFSFRIIGASEDIVNNIGSVLDESLFKQRDYYKDKNLKVISVELKEGVDYSNFIALIKSSKVERRKCGIFASLVTDSDTSGIAVPDFVVDMYLEIGYALDFSFTVI
ncbi:hypothetical protein [Solidesulfovibrio alcoholivorans]|uniref:hypothetical protein n=1 Tax=Solidesulfovibrio alcoholivorans TaxID=81406 RepID=UPI0012EB56E8|nr:hypothetical protein [Solidesulfovibrio alcoholivorans]